MNDDMEDKLYLNSITDKELNNLDVIVDNFKTLYIKNSLGEEVSLAVNEVLSNHNVPVLLNIDSYEDETSIDLNVLRKLSNVKHLDIFVSDGEVESLDALKDIHNLETLGLRKNFKKGVSLDVLNEFSELKKFHLDNGLSIKQYPFVNNLKILETLKVSDLDLSKTCVNGNLKSLRIFRKLLNGDAIQEVFPNLTNVYLERCKEVDIASSIARLPNIKCIWLRYMPHIVNIPFFTNSDNITLFQTTNLSKLKSVSNLFGMKNLKALMMTELEFLTAADFSELTELKNLEVAYVTFKDSNENEKFYEFCEKHNLHYKQPALVNDKFDM